MGVEAMMMIVVASVWDWATVMWREMGSCRASCRWWEWDWLLVQISTRGPPLFPGLTGRWEEAPGRNLRRSEQRWTMPHAGWVSL